MTTIVAWLGMKILSWTGKPSSHCTFLRYLPLSVHEVLTYLNFLPSRISGILFAFCPPNTTPTPPPPESTLSGFFWTSAQCVQICQGFKGRSDIFNSRVCAKWCLKKTFRINSIKNKQTEKLKIKVLSA